MKHKLKGKKKAKHFSHLETQGSILSMSFGQNPHEEEDLYQI
jgi:hypothetical protein